MSNNIQHTPLPWRFDCPMGGPRIVADTKNVEDRHAIAWQVRSNDDAAFIVEACNNYAALRSQLAEAREHLLAASQAVYSLDDTGCYIEERAAWKDFIAKLPEGR